MSEDLSLKFDVTTDDAIKGIEAVNTALGKTKTASTEVTTGVAGIDAALKTAQVSFDKMSNVTGVRGLSVAIVQSQIAMDTFKKAVQDAEAAGTKMPVSVGNSLKTMQGDLTTATARLGTLKAGMAEVGVQATAMGQGWKQAAMSGGSMNSMMLNLAETSTGATGGIAKAGLATAGVAAAFKLGWETGKMIDGTLKEVGIDFSRLGEGALGATSLTAGLANALAKTGIAGADFSKWAKEAVIDTRAYADELEPVILKVNTLMKVHQEAGKELAADVVALKAAGVAWHDAGEESKTTADRVKLLDDALHQSEIEGKAQVPTIQANSKALAELKQRLDDEGISLSTLPPRMQTAILLSGGLTEAHTKHAAAVKLLESAMTTLNPEVTKALNTLQQEDAAVTKSGGNVLKLAQDHDEAVRALVAFGKQTGLSAEEVVKFIQKQDLLRVATNAATTEGIAKMDAALSKLGVNLDDVATKTETFAQSQKRLTEETVAANVAFDAQTQFLKNRNAAIVTGTEVIDAHGNATETAQKKEGSWTPIWLKVTEATEAQNKALMDLLKTTNAYTDSLDKTLTVATGWRDYLAQLVDAYQSGSTSLLAYKNALAEFQTQLLQLFGGATGKAKDAVNDITRAVQNLINTAGAGGPVSMDWSVQGVLDKTFNKPPAKP